VTFSIVARDPESGAFGVASQSHFFALGPLVCWAQAGVGAVATQSFVDVRYGAAGLEAMAAGESASDTLARLRETDDDPDARQVAMIDSNGAVDAFTGARCVVHAEQVVGNEVVALGNMLAEPGIPAAMVDAYQSHDGPFAERLLAALDAAQQMGGDIRGMEAAALKIVAGERPAQAWEGSLIDLRVDDHPQPIEELARLVRVQSGFALLGDVLFSDGLMQGPYREPSPGDLDRALDALERADELLAGKRGSGGQCCSSAPAVAATPSPTSGPPVRQIPTSSSSPVGSPMPAS